MIEQVVPEDVRTELTRAVRRWHQLPRDRAVASAPGAHALMAELAGQPLPDLGPAAVPDQLTVVVHDACAAGADGQVDGLAERLAELRLTWSA